jgi:NitT/TauT family transport system ATP-binding protein
VPPFVELDDVTLTYGGPGGVGGGGTGVRALEGTSIAIEKGEFHAVVGPSGCGKSTLMKLVTGLIRPDSGRIAVAGQPVSGPLKIAGMAFQNPTMLPWRRTLENVLLPMQIVEPHRRQFRARRAEYEKAAENLLATVGLGGFGSRFPWQLSGGMQQRASLCRALIHEPALLMLDEPFAALDAFTREELWCVMRDLWAEKRFTVILVTHDLREAVFLADTIHVMSARPGRIVRTRKVDIRRPRELEVTYEPEFGAIVHELRSYIAEARTP